MERTLETVEKTSSKDLFFGAFILKYFVEYDIER